MIQTFEIAIPLNLNQIFSYYFDEDIDFQLQIGKRVLIDFNNKQMTGFIVGVSDRESIDELKPVMEIIDESPIFSKELLELAKWISEYYFASLGETLKAFLPQGMTVKSKIILQGTVAIDYDYNNLEKRAKNQFKIVSYLNQFEKPVSKSYLEKELGMKISNSQLESLKIAGLIDFWEETAETIKVKTEKAIKFDTNLINSIEYETKISKLESKRKAQYALLIKLLDLFYESNDLIRLETLNKVLNRSLIKKLADDNYFEIIEIEKILTNVFKDKVFSKDESEFELNIEQKEIAEDIKKDLHSQKHNIHLIFGVTGSGKTLIYSDVIKECVALGKTALLLVPEIALTPQLTDRFQFIFPDSVAILHSKMSEYERFNEWIKIKRGETKIVIGARSALFAPLENLGVIIVDEEHDSSYKQDSPNPKYNGRDSAIVRAGLENCTVILGSATPSMESYYNALNGRYIFHKLEKRADNATLPLIEIVDLIDSKKKGQIEVAGISNMMMGKINEQIKKKKGVILLQNRRGFASFVECFDCGNVPQCKNCDVTLTFHKAKNKLICHYCGYTETFNLTCKVCGNKELKEVGIGTQMIEKELEEYYTSKNMEVNIDRLDLDSTAKLNSNRKILNKFQEGKIDILVGTQMLAKGLDIQRVTLVGVVNTDIQLYMQDFRAGERTFQLLTQVAGRAGRSQEMKGEVIFQSNNPNHFVLECAQEHDFEKFYISEIEHRKALNYPPFFRFIKLEISSEDENLCVKHADYIYNCIPETDFLIKFKPTIPAIGRVKNRFRRVVILKSNKELDKSNKKTHLVLAKVKEKYETNIKNNNVRLNIDIDSFSGL